MLQPLVKSTGAALNGVVKAIYPGSGKALVSEDVNVPALAAGTETYPDSHIRGSMFSAFVVQDPRRRPGRRETRVATRPALAPRFR